MFDQKQLAVPANTPATEPATVEFSLTPGMLEKVYVHFPDGCNQMVHVVIYQGERQLIPRDANSTISGNDYTYEITQAARILQGYGKFVARGWSPGSSSPHNVLIGFDTFSDEEKDTSELFLGEMLKVLRDIGAVLGVR